MAKRRTPEELKQIYTNCAIIMHRDGEAAVLAYLSDQEHYATPKATWWYIQKDETFQKIVKAKQYLKEEVKPVETFVMNGVEYTKAEPSDFPTPKTEPKTEEVEAYSDGMVFTEAVPVVPVTKEEPEPIKEPPLGLMPRCIWIEHRTYEILAAMERYSEAGMVIPVEWIGELDYMIQLERSDRIGKTVK